MLSRVHSTLHFDQQRKEHFGALFLFWDSYALSLFVIRLHFSEYTPLWRRYYEYERTQFTE